MPRLAFFVAVILGLLGHPAPARADEIRVAVATNFLPLADVLASEFARRSGHVVRLSSGATGALYGQIRQGAPYDVFLAADSDRPAQLFADGLSAGPPVTYAIGRLVIWAPGLATPAPEGLGEARRIAIANPELAPYGRAAEEALRALGLWGAVSPRLVRGQNVGQAVAMVATGNAEAGLIAAALLPADQPAWPVPPALHMPIRQQAVVMRDAPEAAMQFITFLLGAESQAQIAEAGYGG